MFRELTENGKHIKEDMKDILIEIKKNLEELTVKGMKLGFKSMIWNKRKK